VSLDKKGGKVSKTSIYSSACPHQKLKTEEAQKTFGVNGR